MSLPRFSVNNPVLVNMMMVVAIVAGSLFAFTLVREFFPETRPSRLGIVAVYLGVQPEELERAVTIKVEDAVRDVDGVEKVDSTVSEGSSVTFVSLLNDVEDVDVVLQEIKNKIDTIADLPDDLDQITVEKVEPKLPVINVAIYGPGPEAARKRAAIDLRDDLMRLPGISEVEVTGTREDEISVEVRPERLLEYDVTFDEVAEAIRLTNIDLSGGVLKGSRSTIALRTLGEERRGVDLEDIVVRSTTDGRKILLSDVATIRDEFTESDLESYFNSEPAAHCIVYKEGDQDAIQIANLVKAYVRGKRNEAFDPDGFAAAYARPWYARPFALAAAWMSQASRSVSGRADPQQVYEGSRNKPFDHNFQVALHTDLARFIEGRLDLLTRNGKLGLLLVLISLNLFLNWRVAFWAAVGLPVSFLATFIVMWALGATINLLSMFGLIIVLGIIVDDAIVIGENIYRHVEEGMPPKEAAVRGAEEVMWPVTIAATTTIAAFAPLLFIKGQIGDFMGQLPLVVLAALSVSLLEALIVLPAHLSHLPGRRAKRGGRPDAARRERGRRWMTSFGRLQERLMQGVLLTVYERFLRWTLRWRYVTLSAAAASVLMSLGLWKGGIVPWEPMPEMDSETLVAAVEMPIGSPAPRVRDRMLVLSRYAMSLPEVVNVQLIVARQYAIGGEGSVGTSDQSHLGQLIIELRAADERERLGERNSDQLLAALRGVSETLPNVNSVTWESLNGGPAGKEIEINIGGKRFDEIVQVAGELKQHLATYQGVVDLDDNVDLGKREMQLRLLEAARPTGITVGALGGHVRSAVYGREARRITRNREDVKIMVRYPKEFRKDVYNLESMWIPTGNVQADRGWVPLHEVADVDEAEGYASIHRSQQERAVTVFGDVDRELGNSSEILAAVQSSFLPDLKRRHPDVEIDFLGSYRETQKALNSLKIAFPVALLLVYMLLAGLFRSYFQPLVVMSAIPFGIQGAIVGHWVTGYPLTILSAIGGVALAGILVNDALVLVDFINTRIRNGMSHFEASVEGAKLRLRAILLTTLTTVAGLTPMMFETSFQAKFLIPMAVTLTFGLIFATLLTLILVPTLNMIFFDLRSIAQKLTTDAGADDLQAGGSADLAARPGGAATANR